MQTIFKCAAVAACYATFTMSVSCYTLLEADVCQALASQPGGPLMQSPVCSTCPARYERNLAGNSAPRRGLPHLSATGTGRKSTARNGAAEIPRC